MMHDAYNIKNICCAVFFGKWKQIITAGEEFNIVKFFGFKRSQFLAIPALVPNTTNCNTIQILSELLA